MNPKIFPTILMILDICAALIWFANNDWRKGIYWIAAAILTCSITY